MRGSVSILQIGLGKILRFSKSLIRYAAGRPTSMCYLGSMTLDKDDLAIAKKSLKKRDDWFNKDIIVEFEQMFEEINQSKHAFSFMGGRIALSACIEALGLKKGDKVLVPGYTCVVVPNAFWFEGIEIVFYDIELETFGPDLSDLKEKHKKHPEAKAVLIHHLFGIVAKHYESLIHYCRDNELFIIEDCAHSTGAKFKGRPVGNLGDVAFYSSEQSKVFNTFNGGIAVTNSDKFAERIKACQDRSPFPSVERTEKLIKNVIIRYYEVKYPYKWLNGYWKLLPYKKSRLVSTTKEEEGHVKPKHYGQKMPAPLAKIGLNQLNKIDFYNIERRKNAKRWEEWCKQNNFSMPLIIDESLPIFLRYPVLVTKEMKKNKKWSADLNIHIGIWFVSHLHPVKYKIDDCPNSSLAIDRLINFPTINYIEYEKSIR